MLPGASACFDCLNRGDPEQARIERLSDAELEEELERGYIDETQLSPAPAVVPLNGVIASKTVQIVAKLVTGYAPPTDYLYFEGVDNDITAITTTPREACPTCGSTGVLGRGTREPTEADVERADYDIDLDVGPDSGFAFSRAITTEDLVTNLTTAAKTATTLAGLTDPPH